MNAANIIIYDVWSQTISVNDQRQRSASIRAVGAVRLRVDPGSRGIQRQRTTGRLRSAAAEASPDWDKMNALGAEADAIPDSSSAYSQRSRHNSGGHFQRPTGAGH